MKMGQIKTRDEINHKLLNDFFKNRNKGYEYRGFVKHLNDIFDEVVRRRLENGKLSLKLQLRLGRQEAIVLMERLEEVKAILSYKSKKALMVELEEKNEALEQRPS